MEKKKDGNASVEVVDPKTGYVSEYSMSIRLRRNLEDKVIQNLQKKDKDCIIVVDGREGTGKSTLAFQVGKYVDPSLDLSRVVFSAEDFREAVFKAKKGQCVIYDEAFTGFSSRSSLSPVNKVLVSLVMQMRQKNLFVIIVLPTIFLLDKYVALYRTNSLIHVFESKGVRGFFKVYNYRLKKYLILVGKKTLSYSPKLVRTNFKGRFFGKFVLGGEEVEKEYKKLKEKALQDSEKTSMSSAQVRFKEQRDLILWLFKKYTKLTYQEIETILFEYEFNMSFQQIAKICNKFGDVGAEITKKDKESKNTKKIELNSEKEAESES